MSEGMNKVILLGNLGADPELRFTQGGQGVLNIRLATTESYLDKDKQRQERTDWHSVTVWGKRGEALSKFLRKGSTICVEGSIRTSSYDDKEGNKRYKTEIIANNVILAGGKRGDGDSDSASSGGNGGASRYGASGQGASAKHATDRDDYGSNDAGGDIPF